MTVRFAERIGHGYAASVVARFLAKVTLGGQAECWPWTAYCHKDGYGRFQPGGRGVGKLNAHRFAFLIANGPLTADEVVRHSCDNPVCCNPAHLVRGSHQDNMDDKRRRGRQSDQQGEKAPNRKLGWEQVIEIRRCRGTSICVLAREFGVVKSTISNILSGRTWAGPPPAANLSHQPSDRRSRSARGRSIASSGGILPSVNMSLSVPPHQGLGASEAF